MIERRFITIGPLEVRDADDGRPKIVGYSARFNELSEDLGGFREQIAPGTFKATIKNDDVRALFNHDSNYVLGRRSAGTLKLKEDEKGLWMENSPPDTQWARDLTVSIRRGDITHQSFGFNVLKDEWDESKKDNVIRTLREVKLYDVGPVTFPAYAQTDVQMRSLADSLGIEFNDLSRVFIKAAHKLEITDEEHQFVSSIMDKFYELFPHSAGADGNLFVSATADRSINIKRKGLSIKKENQCD